MLFIAGITISFFLAFLLISKKNKTAADKILGCWLAVIGIHLLLFYGFLTGQVFDFPSLLGISIPYPLLHGPFLYLYTATLTRQLPANRKLSLLHFIPVLLSYLYLIRFFILPERQKIFVFQNKGVGFETYMTVNLAAIIVSGITYVILTHILLRKHRAAILNQFSNTDKINLQWLQYLMVGIGAIWILVIAGNDILIFSAAVLFVLFIGYFGIRQAGIFTDTPPLRHKTDSGQLHTPLHPVSTSEIPDPVLAEKEAQPNEAPFPEERSTGENGDLAGPANEDAPEATGERKKYHKSGLSPEVAERLHRDLTQLMEVEKLYTESELSLSTLANRLNIHPNYLSQVINEKEGKNFYDYINTLRIDAFRALIANPENQKFTILSLAYECGFNSKSSFNRYFKKVTGQSPSEYMETLALEASQE